MAEHNKIVGFAGLGIMGGAMASNLLRVGFPVHVYNRTRAKAEPLIAQGAQWAESPQLLGRGVDTLLTCVTNGAALEEMLFGEHGAALDGCRVRTVVDFSTIPPSLAVAIAARLEERGIRFVDAPVSGGDVGARNGTLSIMIGGAAEVVEELQPIFSAVGKTILHLGPVGSGQLTKCVNQMIVAVTVAAMTEGLCFAQKAGLSLPEVLKAVCSGAANSWALENYAPRILRGDLNPGFYARDMLKDLRIALDEAATRGVPSPVTALVRELYTALCSGEGAELGNHALIRVYEALGGRGSASQ